MSCRVFSLCCLPRFASSSASLRAGLSPAKYQTSKSRSSKIPLLELLPPPASTSFFPFFPLNMCRDSHSQGLLWRQTAQNKIGILANLRNKNAPSLRNAPRSPQEQQDATAHTDTTRTHVLIRNGRKEVTFSFKFNLRKEPLFCCSALAVETSSGSGCWQMRRLATLRPLCPAYGWILLLSA